MNKYLGFFRTISFVLMLSFCIMMLVGCNKGDISPQPATEAPEQGTAKPMQEPTPLPSIEPTPEASPERTRHSTLYFSSDEGYTIPVSVSIPWETGIAKACLNKLVKNEANRLEFQQQGIVGVIPDGTEIELNIVEGHAIVNLKHMPTLPDAEAEQLMFVSIVNTLTEFDSINEVTILLDGKDGRTVNGSALPSNHAAYRVNVEQNSVATSGSANAITLYFPNSSGSLNIPVTRFVQGSTDLYSCISELVSGTDLPNLVSCFPTDTIVLGATLENGVLRINLTEDFVAISETPGLYELAVNSAMLTAQGFGSVDEVIFYVNGIEYTKNSD